MITLAIAGRQYTAQWPEARRAIDGRIRRLLEWAVLDTPNRLRLKHALWAGAHTRRVHEESFRCEHCSRVLRWRAHGEPCRTVCGGCRGSVLVPSEPMPLERWRQWFVLDGETARGPVSAASVAEWVDARMVAPSAVLACAAGRELTPLASVSGELSEWLAWREREAKVLCEEADLRLSRAHDGSWPRLLLRACFPLGDPMAPARMGLDWGSTRESVRWGHWYRAVGLWTAASTVISALWMLAGLLWLLA